MKQASEQYRNEMKEPWRGSWGLNMYIGLIREKFQSSAVASSPSPVSFLSLDYQSKLFQDRSIDMNVATFEQNLFKADGSSYFIEADDYDGMGYQGFMSEEISGDDNSIDCTLTFASLTGESGLRGLTLYFDKVYPTKFTITCKNGDEQVFSKSYTNDSLTFTTTEIFGDNATEMTLQVTEMNLPHVRFRLRYVLFGVAVSFTEENILSTSGSLKSFMHPCSVELPTQDFNISVDNYDGRFDMERSDSIVNLATVGQDTTVQITYTKQDGTIEQIPPTILELSAFDVKGSSLQISAVDFLRNENTPVVFDDPSFFTEETTLYDVAMKVKEYLTNDSFDVVIDDSLKTVPMKFANINTTVKEAFMMIASAGRCIMDLKDKGLFLRRVEFAHADLSAETSDTVPYCNSDILSDMPIVKYASFEQNRQKADGSFLFPDTTPGEGKTGYISVEVSNDKGVFETTPILTLTATEAISPSYLNLQLNSTTLKKVNIKTYYQGEERENLEYNSLSSLNFEVTHDFNSFDKMEVRFLEIYEPYSRVYVSKVSFDSNIYDMTYDICETEKPQASLLDVTRNIFVDYTTTTVDENGAFTSVTNTVTVPCNQKGCDLEYSNPFITTEEVARETGEWLKSYYSMKMQYDVNFMGDPILEPYDKLRIENDYDADIVCEIESCETTFANGGIRGKIVARRMENGVDRTKSKLDA